MSFVEKEATYNVELWFMRCLQVMLFLISYMFSRTLLDFNSWKKDVWSNLIVVISFALLFSLLCRFLPARVCYFLALMALPPYVDETNLGAFFATLEGGPLEAPGLHAFVEAKKNLREELQEQLQHEMA